MWRRHFWLHTNILESRPGLDQPKNKTDQFPSQWFLKVVPVMFRQPLMMMLAAFVLFALPVWSAGLSAPAVTVLKRQLGRETCGVLSSTSTSIHLAW